MGYIELIVIVALLGLNLWQHWFWSKYTGSLIDKLMSRNYAEYKQVEQSAALPTHRTQQDAVASEDIVLNELNSMLGGR